MQTNIYNPSTGPQPQKLLYLEKMGIGNLGIHGKDPTFIPKWISEKCLVINQHNARCTPIDHPQQRGGGGALG